MKGSEDTYKINFILRKGIEGRKNIACNANYFELQMLNTVIASAETFSEALLKLKKIINYDDSRLDYVLENMVYLKDPGWWLVCKGFTYSVKYGPSFSMGVNMANCDPPRRKEKSYDPNYLQ